MNVIISPGAQRDLRKLSRSVLTRVAACIDTLSQDPRPHGCLLLRAYLPPTWRIRTGDWRILYEIDDKAGVITITGVRHRSKAY
jgi:mRNA interferase RelE/StbE